MRETDLGDVSAMKHWLKDDIAIAAIAGLLAWLIVFFLRAAIG